MRLLITGATGFLGSHLVRAFLARGDSVRATRRPKSSLARLAGVERDVEWCDATQPPPQLATDVDVVVHSATHYGRGNAADAEVERVNFNWPHLLLTSTRPPALFVNVDTSLPPELSAYARTKRKFADQLQRSAISGDRRALNLQLESVYGPGDDPAKFQMQLLHALMRNDAEFALTAGAQTRDYIFIDDAVDAMLRLIAHAAASRDVPVSAGVGCGAGISIRKFAETARSVTGSTTQLRFGAIPYREHELMHAAADISLAKSLGWGGGRSLEAGLRETMDGERARL
jgi:CDP-paratose synthetase